jgi:hypothetical protein
MVVPYADAIISEPALIPTKRKAIKRAKEKVTVNSAFKRLFEFLQASHLKKIKTIFPNVIQMFSTLTSIFSHSLISYHAPYISNESSSDKEIWR